MTLAEMERRATLLGYDLDYDPLDDVRELERRLRSEQKPRLGRLLFDTETPLNAPGPNYQDTRGPFLTAALPSVTLAATSKVAWGILGPPLTKVEPTEWWAGKKIRLNCGGQFTTGATPGNLTVELRVSASPLADAAGTLLATTTAVALGASKTNISWKFEAHLRCWSTGNGTASGSLIAKGNFESNGLSALIPAANNPMLCPETAPAATTVDLLGALHFTLQFKRSGSTAETCQVVDLDFEHLN